MLRHRDGRYRWVRARGVTLRDEDGRPVRMAGSCADITEEKEAQLRQAAQYSVTRVIAESATATASITTASPVPRGRVWLSARSFIFSVATSPTGSTFPTGGRRRR